MSRSIGRYLVELLTANGIDTVFGIPGVHNLELYRGLAASNMRHVLVRHEQGAGFAADGYARFTGRPAAAFTDLGSGAHQHPDRRRASLFGFHSHAGRRHHARPRLARQTMGRLHELPDQLALAAGVFGVARQCGDRRGRARPPAAVPRLASHGPAAAGLPRDPARCAVRDDRPCRRAFCRARHCSRRRRRLIATAATGSLAQAARPVIVAGGGAPRVRRGAARARGNARLPAWSPRRPARDCCRTSIRRISAPRCITPASRNWSPRRMWCSRSAPKWARPTSTTR